MFNLFFISYSAWGPTSPYRGGAPPPPLLLGVYAPRNGSRLPRADALAAFFNARGAPPPLGSLARSRSLEPRALRSGVSRTERRQNYTAAATGASQPCALRTSSSRRRTSFHVFGCIIVAFGNMQPSQQMCSNAFVGFPCSSRIQKPAWWTTSSLP